MSDALLVQHGVLQVVGWAKRKTATVSLSLRGVHDAELHAARAERLRRLLSAQR